MKTRRFIIRPDSNLYNNTKGIMILVRDEAEDTAEQSVVIECRKQKNRTGARVDEEHPAESDEPPSAVH